jgi:DNA-binding CsgD family transcriptional regulator
MAAMPERALLDLIGETLGLLELDEFRRGLLGAVRRAVPADWISLNDLSLDPADTVVLIEPPVPPEAHALYAEYAFENPLVARYQRTQDGRAYRFSDVGTAAELRKTNLYREFYKPLGLEHQIAFTLAGTPDRLLALALSRKTVDFSDAERDLLNDARPFLIQCYRNALGHSQLKAELQVRTHGRELPLDDPGLRAELQLREVTARQAEVLACLATGRSNSAIARSLGVSDRTVHKHLQLCFRKLGVHTRADAVSSLWSFVSVDRQPGRRRRPGQRS